MIKNMALTLAVAFVSAAAFLFWRYTSVARGARTRDAALFARLDPLGRCLDQGATTTPEEVQALAASPELRPMLHAMLDHFQKPELFPSQYLSEQAQAESTLVYWLIHPNELQEAPAAVELEARLQREIGGGRGVFYVFRYRMPEGHWAGSEWLLGLAGPFFPDDEPYSGRAGGFSRVGDVSGQVPPEDLVDWYIDMLKRKGGG